VNLSVRIHGRGGQGVVTAAELLSLAAFEQGLHAQALPSFGSERTGAPVVAGCRISDRRIRSHDPVTRPDVLVVQDPTLLRDPALLDGLADGAIVVVNTSKEIDALGGVDRARSARWVTVPATDLARGLLGRPLPNTALVGAVAAVTHALEPRAVESAIRKRFARSELAEANVELAARAFALVDEEVA
jgi:pyruvate ferredoxin oxidoreductase gamma subunit